jgi:hypothetical protein
VSLFPGFRARLFLRQSTVTQLPLLQPNSSALDVTILPARNGHAFVCAKKVEKRGSNMNTKGRFLVGVLTALAMMLLTFALPRGAGMRDAAVVQFPMTVGVWAIFVLLFVRLK